MNTCSSVSLLWEKMLFGPVGNSSLQYHMWPVGRIAGKAEQKCPVQFYCKSLVLPAEPFPLNKVGLWVNLCDGGVVEFVVKVS